MDITSQFSPSKNEEMMKKEATKIVDDKIHTEDVLQDSKTKLIKSCEILQNSIEHNNVEIVYRN